MMSYYNLKRWWVSVPSFHSTPRDEKCCYKCYCCLCFAINHRCFCLSYSGVRRFELTNCADVLVLYRLVFCVTVHTDLAPHTPHHSFHNYSYITLQQLRFLKPGCLAVRRTPWVSTHQRTQNKSVGSRCPLSKGF